MIEMDEEKQAARDWFESLRDRICAEFEAIEREAGSDAAFEYISWEREDPDGSPGGGGVRGVMKGRVFEKVGVNVSTVDQRRGGGPALLRHRHQPGRAHGQSARAGRAHEHAVPGDDQALVRRRRRSQPAPPL
jgi:coproporphyrinogen III oxidase